MASSCSDHLPSSFMTLPKQNPLSSADAVFGNDDLVTEILLRVPAKAVLKLKLVSKNWLSIISPTSFAIRHTRRNPHTVSALLLRFSSFFKEPPTHKHVSLDAARSKPTDYIFNPTTRQFALLPLPPNEGKYFTRIHLVFDPSVSPHYRVVCIQFFNSELKIYVYSSETTDWKLSTIPRPPLPENWQDQDFRYFGESGGQLHFIGILAGNQNPDDLNMGIVSSAMSDDQSSDQSIVVYSMERGCSKWFAKYCLHMNAIVMAYPEITEDKDPTASPFSGKKWFDLLSFIEEKDEEDALLVMRISAPRPGPSNFTLSEQWLLMAATVFVCGFLGYVVYDAAGSLAFPIPGSEPGAIHRAGGSPWGVAFVLLLLVFLISHQPIPARPYLLVSHSCPCKLAWY
ncbi:hypothetical protein OIU84_018268 [Salix udensis]|uniref:F-box domain-containing protein n=1 Tax=Salix udensis TaxID=889485 RepID=A0AAD6PJM1_9ROSI|nr:hypothetical protein OIU84_018268 [Salix udensis]